MGKENLTQRGDPSKVEQVFTSVRLKLWCCRYWQLRKWDTTDMAFPYWRIYWNKNYGGIIGYDQKEYVMSPDTLYIISPNTPYFSCFFSKKKENIYDEEVEGKRVDEDENEQLIAMHSLLHLYIHFNLGIPFDYVKEGIYTIELSPFQKEKLENLTQNLKKGNIFDFSATMYLQSLIFEFISLLDKSLWNSARMDNRVLTVIRYIDRNIAQNHTNEHLASLVHMATNSFARLFHDVMKTPLQLFIKQRKINNACGLFDHNDISIEEVAHQLGFADRYHFSRIFKQIRGVSPGEYCKTRKRIF
ncbi:helix-turn-helix domain-containing protein [Capnocytophaga stomatis]|uniref:helix-turn-helix domain-containing protein n=1 Tax=Capnocytophaga stomatis TaxID=1848904 RepID=UPI00385CAD81